MKRIIIIIGLVLTSIIGLNSCAVEATTYPEYQTQVRAGVYYGYPSRTYYPRHYYRGHYNPRGGYYYR